MLKASPPPKAFSPKKAFNPYCQRNTSLNQVTTAADVTDNDESSFFDAYPTSAPFDTTILEATINALQSKPQAAFNQTCVVCKHVRPDKCNHPFAECPFLQNHPHCQSMYIKAMSAFNTMLKEQRRFSEEDKSATIKQIQAFINDTAEQDFPSGNSE